MATKLNSGRRTTATRTLAKANETRNQGTPLWCIKKRLRCLIFNLKNFTFNHSQCYVKFHCHNIWNHPMSDNLDKIPSALITIMRQFSKSISGFNPETSDKDERRTIWSSVCGVIFKMQAEINKNKLQSMKNIELESFITLRLKSCCWWQHLITIIANIFRG